MREPVAEKPISFVTHTLSAEEKRAMAVGDWKRDGVKALPEGVSVVPHGRAASIYLRKGDRFLALSAELEGVSDVDLCVYTDPGLSSWIDGGSFQSEPARPDEQREALEAVGDWLKARGTRFKFEPPFRG